jgi:hypothetical protein
MGSLISKERSLPDNNYIVGNPKNILICLSCVMYVCVTFSIYSLGSSNSKALFTMADLTCLTLAIEV